MPHPEAYVHYTHHPRWTRETLPEEGMGVQLCPELPSPMRVTQHLA